MSTTGSATFRAEISKDGDEIEYTLSFKNLEGDIRQAHIHIGPEQNSGPIVLWLCQTAANPLRSAPIRPSASTRWPASPRGATPSPACFAPLTSSPQLTNGIAANELAEVLALIQRRQDATSTCTFVD